MTQALFSLAGRTALVTGGNGGLGWAIASGFRAAGAQVAITGRNPQKNAMAIKELGDPKAVLPLDVGDEEAVAQTITQVCEHFGRLDILVNNAGDRRVGGRDSTVTDGLGRAPYVASDRGVSVCKICRGSHDCQG